MRTRLAQPGSLVVLGDGYGLEPLNLDKWTPFAVLLSQDITAEFMNIYDALNGPIPPSLFPQTQEDFISVLPVTKEGDDYSVPTTHFEEHQQLRWALKERGTGTNWCDPSSPPGAAYVQVEFLINSLYSYLTQVPAVFYTIEWEGFAPTIVIQNYETNEIFQTPLSATFYNSNLEQPITIWIRIGSGFESHATQVVLPGGAYRTFAWGGGGEVIEVPSDTIFPPILPVSNINETQYQFKSELPVELIDSTYTLPANHFEEHQQIRWALRTRGDVPNWYEEPSVPQYPTEHTSQTIDAAQRATSQPAALEYNLKWVQDPITIQLSGALPAFIVPTYVVFNNQINGPLSIGFRNAWGGVTSIAFTALECSMYLVGDRLQVPSKVLASSSSSAVAGRSLTSDYATTAGFATTVGTVPEADHADLADHADTAGYATEAGTVTGTVAYATEAGNATTADYATGAGNADTADYADEAGTVTGTVAHATNADYATTAGDVTGAVEHANTSDYAATAGTVTGTVNHAETAGYATTAGSVPSGVYHADTADHADTAALAENSTEAVNSESALSLNCFSITQASYAAQVPAAFYIINYALAGNVVWFGVGDGPLFPDYYPYPISVRVHNNLVSLVSVIWRYAGTSSKELGQLAPGEQWDIELTGTDVFKHVVIASDAVHITGQLPVSQLAQDQSGFIADLPVVGTSGAYTLPVDHFEEHKQLRWALRMRGTPTGHWMDIPAPSPAAAVDDFVDVSEVGNRVSQSLAVFYKVGFDGLSSQPYMAIQASSVAAVCVTPTAIKVANYEADKSVSVDIRLDPSTLPTYVLAPLEIIEVVIGGESGVLVGLPPSSIGSYLNQYCFVNERNWSRLQPALNYVFGEGVPGTAVGVRPSITFETSTGGPLWPVEMWAEWGIRAVEPRIKIFFRPVDTNSRDNPFYLMLDVYVRVSVDVPPMFAGTLSWGTYAELQIGVAEPGLYNFRNMHPVRTSGGARYFPKWYAHRTNEWAQSHALLENATFYFLVDGPGESPAGEMGYAFLNQASPTGEPFFRGQGTITFHNKTEGQRTVWLKENEFSVWPGVALKYNDLYVMYIPGRTDSFTDVAFPPEQRRLLGYIIPRSEETFQGVLEGERTYRVINPAHTTLSIDNAALNYTIFPAGGVVIFAVLASMAYDLFYSPRWVLFDCPSEDLGIVLLREGQPDVSVPRGTSKWILCGPFDAPSTGVS